MGWIYDNYHSVGEWTHLMLDQKEISLSGWIENMCKDTTSGDDMCLYLLARMYNKHVYVHNKLFYWCTAIHKIKSEVDLEFIQDCDIELVFVHPWVFGEVKKVRVHKGIVTTNTASAIKPDNKDTGITENNKGNIEHGTKDCSVSLTRIEGLRVDVQLTPSVEEDIPMRCTGRKCTIQDYNKLVNYDDDGEIDNNLPPSPAKHK